VSARVTVLTRPDCSLCASAAATVARVCAELGLRWREVDVDGDPELRAEYGDRIPVVLIDDREHAYWTVEEDRLRAALAAPA
jgi:glutaredoxin